MMGFIVVAWHRKLRLLLDSKSFRHYILLALQTPKISAGGTRDSNWSKASEWHDLRVGKFLVFLSIFSLDLLFLLVQGRRGVCGGQVHYLPFWVDKMITLRMHMLIMSGNLFFCLENIFQLFILLIKIFSDFSGEDNLLCLLGSSSPPGKL